MSKRDPQGGCETVRISVCGLLCAVGVLLLSGAGAFASSAPFNDAFDYADGVDLNGTNGWSAAGQGAVVVTNGRACLTDARLGNAFEDAQHAVRIAFDIELRFVTNATPQLGIPSDASYAFYVGSNGVITAYNGQTPTNLSHAPLVENTSTQFVVEVDHPVKRWSLWLGGSQIADDLSFYGSAGDSFKEIGFNQHGSNPVDVAYLDDVSVLSVTSAVVSIQLPFYEPFEALNLGALDGQNDWSGDGAVVQSNVVYSGDQAGGLGTNALDRMSRNFFGSHTNVWTELHVRPAFGQPSENPPSDSSFAFYVNTNGFVVTYDGASEVEQTRLVVPADTWQHFMVNADYDTKTWSLYLGGVAVGEGLGFFDTGRTAHESFGIVGSGNSGVYVDEIRVQTSQPSEILPLASFAGSGALAGEGVGDVDIVVNLDRATTNVVQVGYARVGGSATAGADYTNLVDGTLTFAAGQTSTSFTFTVINDVLDEPDETIDLQLGATVNSALGANTSFVFTILHDSLDEDPLVSFDGNLALVGDDAGVVQVPVALFPPQTFTVRVDHAVFDGTAIDGVDYTNYSPGTVVFNPGETSASFSFTTIPNVGPETDRTLLFQLSNIVNADEGSFTEYTAVIGSNSNDWYSLPFLETFESRFSGTINDQRGWRGQNADVQTNMVHTGTRALSLTTSTNFATHVYLGDYKSVWTDMWMKPAFGQPPSPPAGSTFAFHVNTNGHVMAYDGGSRTRMTRVPDLIEGQWTRFSVESDYTSKTWELWVNGRHVGFDLKFRDQNADSYSEFGLSTMSQSNALFSTVLDDLNITLKRPVDLNELLIIIR